jgi:hypothetical protein
MTLPRVTEILRPFTSYDNVPTDILKRSATRGTSVHALCAGFAKGAWIPDGMIDEEYLGYVNSFKKWAEKQVHKFLVIEHRYADEQVGYTGQVDFVIRATDDKNYLVDIKTSAKAQKTYPIQMAAYDHLLALHEVQVDGAMLVYLDKTGEFPEVDLMNDMSREFGVFLSALDCWKYFKGGNRER